MRDRLKRLLALTRLITARVAEEQVSLQGLAQRLDVAKSTLSEDVTVVRDALREAGLGDVHTQVGAAGGVRFVPALDTAWVTQAIRTLCRELMQPDRMTGNGFLFMTDLLFYPALLDPMGALLADRFRNTDARYVVTVETKGIPLALAVARALGVPVVLLRRDNRLSEGPSLSINYLSGSSHRIQSMSLARRSPVRDARVIFVDDFLKAGGTARAAAALLSEFQAEIVGVGVLVATVEPADKLTTQVSACLTWDEAAGIRAAAWVEDRLGLSL